MPLFCSLLIWIAYDECNVVVVLLNSIDNGRELYFLLLGCSVPAFEPFFIELLQDNIKFSFVVIACTCTSHCSFRRIKNGFARIEFNLLIQSSSTQTIGIQAN